MAVQGRAVCAVWNTGHESEAGAKTIAARRTESFTVGGHTPPGTATPGRMMRRRRNGCPHPPACDHRLSWELIAADVAEAKFVEFRPLRVQLMQSIHHVVMPALEPFVDPRRIQDRQFERS